MKTVGDGSDKVCIGKAMGGPFLAKRANCSVSATHDRPAPLNTSVFIWMCEASHKPLLPRNRFCKVTKHDGFALMTGPHSTGARQGRRLDVGRRRWSRERPLHRYTFGVVGQPLLHGGSIIAPQSVQNGSVVPIPHAPPDLREGPA